VTRTICTLLFGASLLLPGSGAGLDFNGEELPWAIVDQPYTSPSLVLEGAARCPVGDGSFTVQGALPPGLAMTGLGQFTGVPGTIGTYRISVRARDTCGGAVRPVTLVVTGAPILVVQTEALEFRCRRGGARPAPQSVLVSGTWPNTSYYIDRPEAPWLHAAPTSGRIPKTGAAVEADRVEISVEPGQLASGSYEAKLSFWTWRGVNVPTVRVRFVVE
jgi:hypothetical protein